MTDPSVLQEIVRRIVEVARPERIILFGSAARGEGGRDSDIDLLIVKSNVHRRRLAMDLYEALAHIGQAVDLIVVTPEDIERYGKSPALVLEPALREGKLLYAS
ncbi:MAG: nucleotidyltransferase domain-containing protein [Candidatus Brocadiia bacterium]